MSSSDHGILIIGSEGQDGRVLQKILSAEGKNVYRQTRNNLISPARTNLGEPTQELLRSIFKATRIEEVYFLAAAHTPAKLDFEGESNRQTEINFNLIQNNLLKVLEIVRELSPVTSFFFASSALVFGEPDSTPQTENTRKLPIEVYGLFKSIAQEIVTFYRQTHGLFAVTGILYPHESEFRKEQFLFRKILDGAISASTEPNFKLEIVDLDFTREWNCAYQVMRSARDTLRINEPQDFVIGSGKKESVREICKHSFQMVNLDFQDYVIVSPAKLIQRSANLLANPDKLYKATGNKPDGDAKALIDRTFKRMQGNQAI
jgi:GDPmannose 4,6-dehydratase